MRGSSPRKTTCNRLPRTVLLESPCRSSRSLGDEGPKLVGAARRDHAAEAGGPDRLVAELLAPRPQPARRMMKRMLVSEAHRAVHLMGDRSAGAGRLAAAHLGDRHLADGDIRKRAGLGGGVC